MYYKEKRIPMVIISTANLITVQIGKLIPDRRIKAGLAAKANYLY